jgi:alpha-beta hydrolase superfamily lysophospholipase
VLFGLSIIFLLLSGGAAFWLAEISIHRNVRHGPEETALVAAQISGSSAASVQKVSIASRDGVRLNGWWLIPSQRNGRAVMICHGVGDSSYSALGFAPLFLKHGYSVLAPDSRGHGESGGFVTYGVLEADDVARWVTWVKRRGIGEVFGLGESLGAAVLIQALAAGARLDAVVAESAYSSFVEAADERVDRVAPRPIAWLLVREGILYVYVRYGINLFDARPDLAIERAQVPVLLIHGLADRQTSSEKSVQIQKRNPAVTTLWLVPGAAHTGAYATDPAGFEQRVLAWFDVRVTP